MGTASNLALLLSSGTTSARLATGVPALDRASRGGLPLGKRVFVGGAPGAGKTGLLVQIGVHMAKRGAKVVILATDEGAQGIATRIAQILGFDRAALERGDVGACSGAVAAVGKLALEVLEGATIEAALAALGSEGARVLVVDSIQTARSELGGRGKKARVDAVCSALKIAADAGVLVLATSELSKASYTGKRAPDLAGFKASGDIEFSADMAIALVSRVQGRTEASIVKSRLGERGTFTLHWNARRAEFTEQGAPARELALTTKPSTPVRAASPWWMRALDFLLGTTDTATT